MIDLLNNRIPFKVFTYRIFSIFEKRSNKVQEVLMYDKSNQIPSVFFFGMNNGKGMSYRRKDAEFYINYVLKNGYDAGVHGINFTDYEVMLKEYMYFFKLTHLEGFGIRMHYVRFNNDTFRNLAKIGYIYDTSLFNKIEIELINPYKVNAMWEFPLHIMDGYVIKEGDIEQSKKTTTKIIEMAKQSNISYLTLLFHDRYYNDKQYPVYKEWYEWVIQYLKNQNYEFISYKDAIKELESQNGESK
ncbi:MAG: hypothetical protein PHP65_00650 [Bacilli bacterium]|nr:hypothetical protein [Bacilli bacterium]